MGARARRDGSWRVRGVSIPGYRHLRDGLECQDAHRHAFEPATGSYVLAVADGAGSRPRSAEGATLAVGLAVEQFTRRLASGGVPRTPDAWRAWLADGFAAVVDAFLDTTARIGGSPGDFAATLTVAVLAPPFIGTVSIGDGIVIVGAEGMLHLVTFEPPAGEYVNETQFLSSKGAAADARTQVIEEPELTALLLATDGVVPVGVRRDGHHPAPQPPLPGPGARLPHRP